MSQYPGQRRGTTKPKGNNWADQDEALFGPMAATKTPSPAFCKPCSNSSPNEDDFKPSAKEKISSFAGNASSKLSKFISKTKDEVSKVAHGVNQRTNGDLSNSTKDTIQKSTNKTKSLHQNDPSILPALPSFTTEVPRHQPPCTSPSTRQDVSRMMTNALTSQIPLKCLHCSSFPLMYQTHPFFGATERICSSHPAQSVTRCVSCFRFQPKKKPFALIGTSTARICPSCARTAILDNGAAKKLYEHVLQFMEREGLDMFGGKMKNVPVVLVSEDNLNRQSSTIGCNATSKKRGLTIWSEMHIPLPDVVGLAKSASKALRRVANRRSARTQSDVETSSGNREAEVKRNIWGGSRHVIVQKILCLKGLPRNLMGSILAHEATHAWLAMNPIRRDGVVGDSSSFGSVRRIDSTIEEGICQLVSHLYLQTLMTNDKKEGFRDHFSRNGPSDVKLNQYYKWAIENHPSPVYGGGFKKAAVAYTQTVNSGGGLKELIQYVTIHRDFPPV